MLSDRPFAVILSGPPGAGKTTVASQLAERFPRTVHLETDFFLHSIRNGRVLPWLADAHEQNEAAVTAAARSIASYAERGYAVFVDGVILPWALEIYRSELAARNIDPLVFVLIPDLEETIHRGTARTTRDPLDVEAYRHMHAEFVREYAMPDGVTVIGEGSIDAIVDRIYEVCSEAGLQTD